MFFIARKVKRKKLKNIVTFLLIAVIIALVIKPIITSGNQHPFAESFNGKTPPLNSSVSIPFDTLNSPYAILIRLGDKDFKTE